MSDLPKGRIPGNGGGSRERGRVRNEVRIRGELQRKGGVYEKEKVYYANKPKNSHPNIRAQKYTSAFFTTKCFMNENFVADCMSKSRWQEDIRQSADCNASTLDSNSF